MALLGQVLDMPHSWVPEWSDRKNDFTSRFVLNTPSRLVVKTRHFSPGHFEASVRWVNLQPIADRADPELRRLRRVLTDEEREENLARSALRAKQAVRVKCIQIKADRMGTFGTRAVLPLSVLVAHWHTFCRDYKAAIGQSAFLYCAVPETHSDGVHYHLHVAIGGWFHLAKALRIWHAITAGDCSDHEVNGSINIKQFVSAGFRKNPVCYIAGYIAKYIAKRVDVELGKKRYWASRTGVAEVNHVVLDADTWDGAKDEISRRFGVDWAPLFMSDSGDFFVFPYDRGFWFRCVPMSQREGPPF